MCGIWFLLHNGIDTSNAYASFRQINKRGPDRSYFIEHNTPYDFTVGFHRLSIMDPSMRGDQPFVAEYVDDNGVEHIVNVICNGEIYHYKSLASRLGLKLNSGSDCEVIIRAYINHGIDTVVNEIHGEFAFAIIDIEKLSGTIDLYIARDPFGIRPLFIDVTDNYINLCSEAKGLLSVYNSHVGYDAVNVTKNVRQFKGGELVHYRRSDRIISCVGSQRFYNFPEQFIHNDMAHAKNMIVETFTEAVESKLETDRPLGCLLSGGLDSSLVTAIAARYLAKSGKKLRTFSIGMEGSTDEQYARMVADHCGTDHTHVEFEENVWIGALRDVIKACETYDITTIRASTGQYLISKWIAENTDIKVLLIGDGSDELCSGYLYFHRAPNATVSDEENRILLDEIAYYDVLRADRGVAGNGLEARVPFLDTRFVDLYLQIAPTLRVPINGVEKWLLRESFRDTGLLPSQVLFRKKEAFSDGVSSVKKSWFKIIQEYADEIYTDEYLRMKQLEYKHNMPPTKEALLYREWFEAQLCKGLDHLIPHYWLPKWCGDINEPSARILTVYK